MTRLVRFGFVFCLSLFAVHARGAQPDPAARGLDAFVHGASEAPSGGSVRLDIETFGFAQVTSPAPLGGVSIDAAWDPESFGEPVAILPQTIHAESDGSGRVVVDVPVPRGEAHSLKLMLAMHHGVHARTRVITIARTKALAATIRVSQSAVVPGGTVTAWVHVARTMTDEPVQNARVDVGLYEGSYRRARLHATTDVAGMALVRIPIPESDDPSDSWQLSATAEEGAEHVTAETTLVPRDETPGAPFFDVRFDEGNVRAGAKAPFTIVLRDAVGTPVAGASLRYWIGQNGMNAPDEDALWEKATTLVKTDLRGEVHASADAPKVVAPNRETELHVVARGELEGQKISHEAYVPVSSSNASVSLVPEAQRVVPGLEQRLHLTVHDGLDAPIAGAFDIEGDGLKQRVTTDAHGEAEITWRAPETLGALRETGPCAGGVAATVRIRAAGPAGSIAALASHTEAFVTCVAIDRDAFAIVVPDKRVVRAGETLGVKIASRDARAKAWSTTLGRGTDLSQSTWIEDGARGGTITVPPTALGVYDLDAVSPLAKDAARTAHTSVLVLPSTIPHLEAKVVSGRVAPGGVVDVDAVLTDESGRALQGTVTAMLVDLEGGGSLDGVLRLDTRTSMCALAGADPDRCSDLLSNEAASEPLRRELLGPRGSDLLPLIDPGASVVKDLDASFSDVLHSLEGAVFAASQDPDRLVDVRRKTPGGGFTFNPELMTLTTAAMDHPPETPGGEPLALGDLLAIDPQVTFDNVAKRVTRYKLFKVLQAVRDFKVAHALDAGEPALRDPNALLRRLVRGGQLSQGQLVDPWGGSMAFTKSNGPMLPFLSTIPGFELRAPGPDGIIGTGDDVSDPFVRVVKSGSPYARAMQEDLLVDSKLDMEVAQSTVDAWSTTMETVTGLQLGLGMVGHGEGGGGSGYGMGMGGIGTIGHGSGRGVRSLTNGDAYFQTPVRTDANGHVHFTVPLGDIETTWGLGLLALPDHAPPASTKIDLVASQPVSLAANAGAAWTVNDESDVRVLVRNRTNKAIEAKVTVAADGVAVLAMPPLPKSVHVDAESVASFAVRVRAPRAGEAAIVLELHAPSGETDRLRYAWDVLAAGELVTRTAARWVEGTSDVGLDVDSRDSLTGRARLVLTRGSSDALDGALAALDPDSLHAEESIADAMETSARILRWGPAALHDRASNVLHRASERALAILVDRTEHDSSSRNWLLARRFRAYAASDVTASKTLLASSDDSKCPPKLSVAEGVVALSVLPHTEGSGAELPCWETFVADITSAVRITDEPTTLARALLALSDRPERAIAAAALADRLRELVHLAPSGSIRLLRGGRADRTLVYAALLRANKLGTTPVTSDRLAAWIAVDRDASGSFGSTDATRAVVRALTEMMPEAPAPETITVDDGASSRTVTLDASGVIVLGLGANTTHVTVHAPQGVVARLERPMLRGFSHPPDASDSPLRLDVTWPDDARAGHISSIHVTMSNVATQSVRAVARIPLPPGASMVGPMTNVKQVHGALLITGLVSLGNAGVIDVPLRFSLAGRATIREARILAPNAPLPRGVSPAQAIVIR
jgi:hypothetical protein